jgi:RimJ/RimL family protein N-acetyltransferase
MIIQTDRTILRPWTDTDADALGIMLGDPEVMVDYPAPLSRAMSDDKLRRYRDVYDRYGYTRWLLERRDGAFLGYVGILPITDDHPLAPGVEIGWRLMRAAWGHGYVTEAAAAALQDGFERMGFDEVLCYTLPTNLRSQAVMNRLGLTREASRDFITQTVDGPWNGWTWTARPGRNR